MIDIPPSRNSIIFGKKRNAKTKINKKNNEMIINKGIKLFENIIIKIEVGIVNDKKDKINKKRNFHLIFDKCIVLFMNSSIDYNTNPIKEIAHAIVPITELNPSK